MFILVPICLGIAAFYIGYWRASCIIWQRKMPTNTPTLWHNILVRSLAINLSIILTVSFAWTASVFISKEINQLLGQFAFGALIALRWALSSLYAGIKIDNEIDQMDKMYPELRIRESVKKRDAISRSALGKFM